MFNKSVLIFTITVALIIMQSSIFATNLNQEGNIFRAFQQFLQRHNKTYPSNSEFNERYQKFKNNFKQVKIANESNAFNLNVNQFADLEAAEFRKSFCKFNASFIDEDDIILGSSEPEINKNETNTTIQGSLSLISANSNDTNSLNSNLTYLTEHEIKNDSTNNPTIPVNWDWRDQGVVSSVKQQQSCGGCWAFSAAANIEGLFAIKYGKLNNFSIQQTLDCVTGNEGCEGGATKTAFTYLSNVGGLMLNSDYPYEAFQDTCRFNETKAIAKVKGSYSERSRDEEKIKELLFKNGPLSGALDATDMQFYEGGIFHCDEKRNYGLKDLNHAINIVGYGTEGSEDYWIIKNSWGPQWGEEGYLRLARNKKACGIQLYVVTAQLE